MNKLKEILDKEFSKNMFLVECDSMKPYLKKGDVAIYEPIQKGRGLASSIYLIQTKGYTAIKRVAFNVGGGIIIISDNDQSITEEVTKEELKDVVFIGHVIGRIIKDYSLYEF